MTKKISYGALTLILIGSGIIFFAFWINEWANQYLFKPEVIITKEECSEDLISTNQNTICQAECLYGVVTTLMKLEENKKDFTTIEERKEIVNGCKEMCTEKIPIIKKCERVEVEFLSMPYIDNCIGIRCPKEKKDLTTNWLDENCKITGKELYICGDYKIEVKE